MLLTFLALSVPSLFAQTKTVTGSVNDEAGAAMQGVSVVPKGSSRGATSSADGKFSLTIPDNTRIIVFSYVGYTTQEVTLDQTTDIVVSLKRDSGNLNDIVVIGYGTARRKDITGAVSSVKLEGTALSLLPNMNALEALKGNVSGLNIGAVNTAGGQPSILIRGQRSISGSNDPLILLDGVIYLGSISDINPNDIASYDILKDAVSAATYGSRSANGIIAITTKKGKTGKPAINFRANGGVQSWQNKPVMMKGAEWINVVNDRNKYAPGSTNWLKAGELANLNAGKEIVWLDEVTQTGVLQDYQVSVSGAAQNINYYLSTSYNDNKGIIVGDEFNRVSVFGKINTKVTSWFEVGADANYSKRDYSDVAANIGAAQLMSPYGVMFRDDAGNLERYPYTQSLANPLWGVQDGTITNKDITDNFRLNAYAVVRIPWIKGLSYRVNYLSNVDRRQTGSFFFENYYIKEGAGIPGRYDPASVQSLLTNANGNIDNILTKSYVLDNILNYETSILKHRINITAVATRDHRKYEDVNSTGNNFAANGNTTLGYFGLSKATVQKVILNNEERSNVGYLARLNYSFDDKYYLTGSIRRDGASVFGAEKIWANFAAVGGAWMISRENFLKKFGALNSLKLKASWGQNGNQGLSPYATLSQVQNSAAGNARYEFSNAPGTISYGLVQTTLGNPSLGWEKTTAINFGFESGWLNNRLFVDVDAYSSRTTDQIFVRVIPIFTGFNTQLASLGEVSNKGVEITVRTVNMQKKDLTWSSAVTFWKNNNKLVHLYNEDKNKDGLEDDDIANNFFIGKSLGAIFGYEQNGIVQTGDADYITMTGAAPGAPKYKDLNGDKKIDATDRTILGYAKENFRLNLSNTLRYKNLELYVMVSGLFGGNNMYLDTNTAAYMTSGTGRFNDNTISKPYWTATNPSNTYPSAYFSGDSRFLGLQSRGFIRIQDISLSYSFDTKWMKSARINTLRVFAAAKNLFTFTDWEGGDPELGTTVQANTFPVPTTLSLGINLGF
ncbi:MAG TPA: SusC/RagA family TonB-linked outer membrane protein [Flavitalea sp.]|nr:SusC/RagA family TonB-linked outer membrane protein [Flavitalea sp.]